ASAQPFRSPHPPSKYHSDPGYSRGSEAGWRDPVRKQLWPKSSCSQPSPGCVAVAEHSRSWKHPACTSSLPHPETAVENLSNFAHCLLDLRVVLIRKSHQILDRLVLLGKPP